MHHKEHDSRHPHHYKPRHQQEHYTHPHQEENFNDSRSRWGEPSPYIHLNHQGEWHPEDTGRFEDQGRYHHREEWLPDQHHRQHQQRSNEHNQRHPESRQHHQEPIWRQRDVNFDSSNQRVEDRWYEDPLMPHPESRRRRRDPRDDYWHERDR
jgi:hypothetical protein